MNKCFFILFSCFVYMACNNKQESNENVNQLAETAAKYPDSSQLQYQYLQALDSADNTVAAIEQVNKLLLKDKGNAGLWFKKGNLHIALADTNNAIAAYENAAAIYASPEILLALVNIYAEKANPKTEQICKAIDALKLGREYEAYTTFFRGIYMAKKGNDAIAVELFNKAIALNYTFTDAYLEKGYILFDNKQYSDALEIFTLSTKVNATFADGFYWQAKCYEALNQKNKAIDAYQTAYNLNNTITEAKEALQRLQ